MFSVFDQKAQAYLPPFFMHAEGMAIRSFGDCIEDPEHQFGKHPEDYTLYEIGEFDDSKGMVKPLPHHSLGNGVEYGPFKTVEEIA